MKLIKEIKSKTGILHFRRWQILWTPWFSIWIHGIYSADKDEHLHNHPWDYFSLVLKGSFLEETESGTKIMRPLSYVKRDGSEFHKIKILFTPKVYTLFITSPPKRDWGYKVKGKIIQHDIYRNLKNDFLL